MKTIDPSANSLRDRAEAYRRRAHASARHRPIEPVAPDAATPTATPQSDPAVIVSLAMQHAKLCKYGGTIPAPILDELHRHVATGNATCRLVAEWIERRGDRRTPLHPVCGGEL
ncbi:hypothetical protein [Consotaella aegiceratis]|uniref:hypothetical protein n=1 Tax=Consotaella aegiceratis TaxID=3097961 RepID=UPI002F4198B5